MERSLKKPGFFFLGFLGIWGIVLTLLAGSLFFFFKYRPAYPELSDLRLSCMDAVRLAEDKDYVSLSAYSCFIVDTRQKITFSTLPSYPAGDFVSLHSLSSASGGSQRFFACPLLEQGVQYGTLAVYFPESPILPKKDVPLLLFFSLPVLLLLLITVHFFRTLKTCYKQPLSMANAALERLLCGGSLTPFLSPLKKAAKKVPEYLVLSRQISLVEHEFFTLQKRELLLRENEKRLLACISHDLKTPITAILGCAEGIFGGFADGLEKQKEYAGIIIEKTGLLNQMIDQVMEHSISEMNDFTISTKELYLKPYLTRVFSSLSYDLSCRNIKLTVSEIPDLLVRLDPERIYQVIQNIFGNSIKYAQTEEPEITVKVSRLASDFALVEITDNGPGVPPEDVPFVFERFFRSEKARTQNVAGNGLGLSIVKNIVEKHGGFVDCESTYQKSFTIIFSLPLA